MSTNYARLQFKKKKKKKSHNLVENIQKLTEWTYFRLRYVNSQGERMVSLKEGGREAWICYRDI